MPLVLSPDVQRLIEDRMKTGRYASVNDLVAAALFTLEQQENLAKLSTEELNLIYPGLQEKIDAGLAAAREGKVSDGEAFFAELEREDADNSGRKSA